MICVIFYKKEVIYIMAYYKRIRDLREDSDKTQKEVAEYLGTPYQYYSRYEHGGSEISFERAILLAQYYNVSLDYIAGLTNNKKGLTASELTEEQQKLLRFISGLSGKKREFLLKFLEEIENAVK